VADEFENNRRKWQRKTVQLPAQYFIKAQSTRHGECTIVNLSRGGAAALFPPNEPVTVKAPIFLGLFIPKTLERLTLRGEVIIKYKSGDGLLGGIQFESLLPEDLFAKLI
jgi:hypothetical protein